MDALLKRVQRALEAIVTEDGERNGTVTPAAFGSVEPFVWLVRYQILDQSRGDIAKASGRDKAQVSRTIKRTAGLVGISLRTETPGPAQEN